jgi:glutamine cyclotransferase
MRHRRGIARGGHARRRAAGVSSAPVAALVVALVAALGCGGGSLAGSSARPSDSSGTGAVVNDRARIVASFPHDTSAYTQGLIFHAGALYESTGLFGRSSVRRVELETGRVEQSVGLDPALFGEGIALVGETIYQVTWQAGRAFAYDRATLERRGSFTYEGDGWGLATDGQSLILSDGSSRIRFLDPATFRERRSIFVTGARGPVTRLNELEMVDGEIWANVWQTDSIVRIDAQTGALRGVVDLAEVTRAEPRADRDADNVPNGIAHDAAGKRLFVTGKRWSRVYEIELVP